MEKHQLNLAALRRAIDEGDEAYARGDFTAYDQPGELAADLKADLLTRVRDQK